MDSGVEFDFSSMTSEEVSIALSHSSSSYNYDVPRNSWIAVWVLSNQLYTLNSAGRRNSFWIHLKLSSPGLRTPRTAFGLQLLYPEHQFGLSHISSSHPHHRQLKDLLLIPLMFTLQASPLHQHPFPVPPSTGLSVLYHTTALPSLHLLETACITDLVSSVLCHHQCPVVTMTITTASDPLVLGARVPRVIHERS